MARTTVAEDELEMPGAEKAPMDYTPQQIIDWAPEAHGSEGASADNETKGTVSRLPDATELRCDVSVRDIEQADEHNALPRAEQRALRQRGKFKPMKLADLAKLRRKKGTDLGVFARNHKLIAKLDEDDEAVAILGKNGEIIRHSAYGLSLNFEGKLEVWNPAVLALVRAGATLVHIHTSDTSDTGDGETGDPHISGCISFDPADDQQVKLILKIGGIDPKKRGTEESRAKAGERLRALHAARRAASRTVVPEGVPVEPAFA